MGIEGRLQFNVQVQDDSVSGVEIVSSRPLSVTRMFAGKTPQEVLSLIPALYSICGTAQACAALGAVERAQGVALNDTGRRGRNLAVWAETAREHLLRLAMMMGRPSETFAITEIMPMSHEMIRALSNTLVLGGGDFETPKARDHIARLEDFLERAVFGEELATWRARKDEGSLMAWVRTKATDVSALLDQYVQDGWMDVGKGMVLHALPALDDRELLGKMKSMDFIERPLWHNGGQSQAFETTPLARQKDTGLIAGLLDAMGAGLLTRLAALLVELSRIPLMMQSFLEGDVAIEDAWALEGAGLAQVEAARGRLAHAVWIEDGLVADYRVLAPTEWNFHPQGIAARALQRLPVDGVNGDGLLNLKKKADALINSIDPCVAYEVSIS